MNYIRIYDEMMQRSVTRNLNIEGVYYERHHIIPRCVGGEDIDDNIAILTAREHYVAHQLLTKMYPNNKKLIYAANMMTVHDSDNRSCNRRYEWLRRKFAENHPCKSQDIKDKIGKTLSSYYATEEYKNIVEHRRKNRLETRVCRCGCGETFTVNKKDGKCYVSSSHVKPTEEMREKKASSIKKYISSLTVEEQHVRMDNSLRNCDQVKRGISISIGKKGKKTNQQEIVGKRYANMSDEDFNSFISSKSSSIRARSINLRNKWQKIS